MTKLILFFISAILFSETGCTRRIVRHESNIIPTVEFNLQQWRHLLKESILNIKKNNNCSEFKEYIDSVALKTERQNPAWDEFSLEKVFEFVGEKPKNATICIITSETSGEVYSNETIVFWLKHNRYIGAFWVKGDLRPFEKSKHDYTKLKRMSTLCNKGYTSFGEIIFTEINGENMWVKAVLFPTIEQENSIYSFMSSGD